MSHEWKVMIQTLSLGKNWKETMRVVIVALLKTWLTMSRKSNISIDANTRYCIQVQDDNNKLSLQITYRLRHILNKLVNRMMENTIEEHLTFPREPISDRVLITSNH